MAKPHTFEEAELKTLEVTIKGKKRILREMDGLAVSQFEDTARTIDQKDDENVSKYWFLYQCAFLSYCLETEDEKAKDINQWLARCRRTTIDGLYDLAADLNGKATNKELVEALSTEKK